MLRQRLVRSGSIARGTSLPDRPLAQFAGRRSSNSSSSGGGGGGCKNGSSSSSHSSSSSTTTTTSDSNSSSNSDSSSSNSRINSGGSLWQDESLRRHVGVLVGSQVMLNIGVSQVVPVLPILAAEMNLGATGIGALMAASSSARLALNLPLGKLCDTLGRKPLMQYGTLITAAGCVGTGFFMHSGLPAVLASRLLVGAGSASSMTGSSAMMADLTDRAPQHRAQMMALQSFVLSGVWVVGPACGGLLANTYGAQNSFYIAGVAVALCSFGYGRLPETLLDAVRRGGKRAADAAHGGGTGGTDGTGGTGGNGGTDGTNGTGGTGGNDGTDGSATSSRASASSSSAAAPESAVTYHRLLRAPNVQALSALAMSTAFSQGGFMAVLTLHAANLFNASPADIGLMFSMVGLSYVAGGPIGGWLASFAGRKRLIVPGLALSNLAFGSLVFADSKEAFFALLLLSNFSSACVSPALSAFTAEVLPPEARGQALAVSRMSADVASLGAPLALGMLADATTSGTAIVTTACLCGSGTALFALRADERAVLAFASASTASAAGAGLPVDGSGRR